jgi:quinol monooxygenase YgiN
MYGTIAKIKVTPGSEGALVRHMATYEELDIPGHESSYVMRTDADPGTYFVVAVFRDEAAYRANADDPAQHARFLEMRSLLVADPEWNDGEFIYADD